MISRLKRNPAHLRSHFVQQVSIGRDGPVRANQGKRCGRVHQVNLGASGGPWSTSILACRVLSGEKDAVVEFEYEFLEIPNVVPEALLQRVVHLFFVDITDIHGNDESGYLRYVEVSKDQVAVLEGHGAWVRSVAFSPDGTTLASGSSDGTAKLWDVASREAIATLYPRGYQVTSVDFSPDGTILAGTGGGHIMLWGRGVR